MPRLYMRKLEFRLRVFTVMKRKCQQRIGGLIDYYRPDILVITGHDAYSKAKGKMTDINAYRHSKHFVQTVKEARKRIPHLDQLVIFAGACQSHFESLIPCRSKFCELSFSSQYTCTRSCLYCCEN